PRKRVRMAPKKFGFASTAVLVVAGLVVLTIAFARHPQLISVTHASTAQAQTATAPGPAAASAQSPAPEQQLPPGTITYQAKAVTTAQFLARMHLTESKYMTVAEYVDAIAAVNGGKKSFKRGDTVLIPGIEPQPVVEKSRPFPKDGEVRAIYMTGDTAGSARGIELVRHWHEAGGNAVVFDIKDSDGSISIPFQHPLARKITHYPISNLPKYVRYLHS